MSTGDSNGNGNGNGDGDNNDVNDEQALIEKLVYVRIYVYVRQCRKWPIPSQFMLGLVNKVEARAQNPLSHAFVPNRRHITTARTAPAASLAIRSDFGDGLLFSVRSAILRSITFSARYSPPLRKLSTLQLPVQPTVSEKPQDKLEKLI
ncbi:hypothetical protein WUBG_05134 [Wuchereria bancrofti]|uniref:Uncharacterized protein n=1 Tax=Wuchereria bancrofti TaxID=6293 RepID=J9EN60_WUCBA|nr:hypothetical protein WUBG_05134 [Wuchereria bancrofti]